MNCRWQELFEKPDWFRRNDEVSRDRGGGGMKVRSIRTNMVLYSESGSPTMKVLVRVI